MLRRQDELENGTAWSLSSESSDDSSSPQLSGTARHSSTPKPLVQQPEPLPIQVAFRRPEPLTSSSMEEEPAVAPAMVNGHAPYSRTLSHISEASVDAALTEAVEAAGSESLILGPSPLVYPDSTHVEHFNNVPPVPDTRHSATRPTPSTTGPVPTCTPPDLVHKATNSDPSECPSLTHTSSTYTAVSTANNVPSPASTTVDSTPKPTPSTLTTTGSSPSALDPIEATTNPPHTTPSPTHTTASVTHTTASPKQSTPSPTHTTISPTCTTPSPTKATLSPSHRTTSPTRKTGVSTHTTTSHTTSAVDPVQIITSPISATESPTSSIDLAVSSSFSADPTLPGTEPLPCSHPATTPYTKTDNPASCTSYQSLACSCSKSLISPASNSPEQIPKSPNSSPSSVAPAPQHSELSQATAAQAPVPEATEGAGDKRLEEALGTLMAALDDYRGQFPELQGLEQEVTRLESLLMVRRLGWAETAQRAASQWQQLSPLLTISAETRPDPKQGLQS